MPWLGYIGDKIMDENNTMMQHNDESNVDTADSSFLILRKIWDCPNLNKALVPGRDGTSVPGWICGWCPPGRGFFKGDNATKALAHVAKIPRMNIRMCDGNIPQHKLLQYRNLMMAKSNAKSNKS